MNKMKRPKYNNMLMHGFILVTILATAKSAEAEITMEAAFQGHCGHTSPCEQLCYEIHDGMYECDCIEGYELNKNGYSCQVINTTTGNDVHSKSEEDVLYQKGASFSAKLANDDNENDDNSISQQAGTPRQLQTKHTFSSSSLLGDGLSSQYASLSSSSSLSASEEDDMLDVGNYYSDDLDHILEDRQQQQQQQKQAQEQQRQQQVNFNTDYYISTENTDNFNKKQVKNHNDHQYHQQQQQQQPQQQQQEKLTQSSHQAQQKQKQKLNLYTNSNMNLKNNNKKQSSPFNYNQQQVVPEFTANAQQKTLQQQQQRIAMTATKKPIKISLNKNVNMNKNNKFEQFGKSSANVGGINGRGNGIATNTPSKSSAAQHPSQPLHTNTEAITNVNIYDDYYAGIKQDMSIYDDVNNNQLNLRPLSHNPPTYQAESTNSNSNVHARNSPFKAFITNSNRPDIIKSTTTTNTNDDEKKKLLSQYSNISTNTINNNSNNDNERIFKLHYSNECNLDCGIDGQCDNNDGISRCLCPFGKSGENCLEDTQVRVPKFSKKSWLAFPALRGAYKHVQIRVEFRPESFDGIILLSGERDDLTGDFMALLLNKGFVEFWFDCGSGVGSVRSRETILLNEWNSVIIYRHRWDAWLVLNHGSKVQGRSNGLFSRITFREPVFLGGTGNITGLAKRLPVFTGFIGCIRRFVANEHEYKFEEHPIGDVTKGFDIQDCVTDKCFKFPCQHGGKCLPSDQGAVCLCPIGFVGDLCEIRMDLQVPAFNGSSYLRYAPLGDSALIWLELKVILKPEQPDGLILYSGPKGRGDFIALSLNNGIVEFAFDLGSGPATVRSEYPLAVGQWHTIKLSRTARLAVLKIDQLPEVMTISSNGFWHLSLPENLFVGGVDHADKLPMDYKYKPLFMGCIQQIDINGHSLAIISEALGGANIGNCPHACVARPCGPLSQCIPQMENYECRCSTYNAACNKAAEVPLEELQINKAKSKAKFIRNHEAFMKSKKNPNIKKHIKDHTRYLHKSALPATTTSTTTTTTSTTTTTTTAAPTTTTSSTMRIPILKTQLDYDDLDFSPEDVEDDIIFRDVQKKYEEKQQKQQQQQQGEEFKHIPNHEQRNVKVKRVYGNIMPDKMAAHIEANRKPDPHHKHVLIESKLSRMPAHYESFQTNPDGDILTFGDDVELDFNFSEEKAAEVVGNTEDDSNNDNDSNYIDNNKTKTNTNDNNSDDEEEENESATEGMDSTLFDDDDGTEEYHRKELVQDMRRIMANPHHKHEQIDYQEILKQPPPPQPQPQSQPTKVVQYSEYRPEPPKFANKLTIENSDDDNSDDDSDDDEPASGSMENIKDENSTEKMNKKYNVNNEDNGDGEVNDDTSTNDNNNNEDEDEEDADDDLLEPIQNANTNNNPSKTNTVKITPQTHTDWSLLKKLDLSKEHLSQHPIGVRKNFGACFAGEDSYFHYNDAETMSQIISYSIDLNLRIKTHSDNGVILWTGRQGTTDEDDDYLSLGIENGLLHFRYDLGSGEVNIRFNQTKISDGLWHRVRAIRNSQQGYLEVDGRKSSTQRSPGKLRQLNTDTGLYVGGMPDVNYFTRRRYTSGIVGCISEIVLAGELKLNFDPNTLGTAHNVETGIL